jgi:type IV pilus assembly protein PilA
VIKGCKRFFRNFRRGQKGFTLVELLVVVAILGVLAAVAVPNVAKFVGSGKTQAALSEKVNVQTSVSTFMADKGYSYATQDGTVGGTALTTAYLVTNSYLSQTPHNTYTIASDGTVTQTIVP